MYVILQCGRVIIVIIIIIITIFIIIIMMDMIIIIIIMDMIIINVVMLVGEVAGRGCSTKEKMYYVHCEVRMMIMMILGRG